MPAQKNRMHEQAPPAPKAGAAAVGRPGGQSASLYTVQAHVELFDTSTIEDAGLQVTFYDSNFLKDGAPAVRHGPSTLTSRTAASLKLPRVPAGVERGEFQMRLPLAQSNPTNGKSWAFVAAAVGSAGRAAKAAIARATAVADALFDQAFFNANFDAPEQDDRAGWSARAQLLEGRKNTGDACTIQELINFNARVATNAPPAAQKAFAKIHSQCPSVVTLVSCKPSSGLSAAPPPGPTSSTPAATSVEGATTRKRPSASSGGRPLKRP
ncbi:unnamed protein product, partial [Prorocentrum cordatum]